MKCFTTIALAFLTLSLSTPAEAQSACAASTTGFVGGVPCYALDGRYFSESPSKGMEPDILITTGTRDATTFLRGDDVWAAPAGDGNSFATGVSLDRTGDNISINITGNAGFTNLTDTVALAPESHVDSGTVTGTTLTLHRTDGNNVTIPGLPDGTATRDGVVESAVCSGNDLVVRRSLGLPDITFQEVCIGAGGGSGEQNVQADWSVTDTASDAFIRNKPTIPGSFDLHDDVTTQASSINATDRFLLARESIPGDPQQYGTGTLVANFVLNRIIDSDIPATIARDSELSNRLVRGDLVAGANITLTPGSGNTVTIVGQAGGGTADGVVNSVAMNVNANTLTVSLGRTVGGTVSGQTTIPGADGVTASGACSGNDLVLTRTRGLANVTIQEACVGAGSGAGEANVQADFAETDSTSDAFIRNKPDILVSHRDGHGPPTVDPTASGQVQINNDGEVFPAADTVTTHTSAPTVTHESFSNSDWAFWNNVHTTVSPPGGVTSNPGHFYYNAGQNSRAFYQNQGGAIILVSWAQALQNIREIGETIPDVLDGSIFLGHFEQEVDAARAQALQPTRDTGKFVWIILGGINSLERSLVFTAGTTTSVDNLHWRNRLANVDDIANLGLGSAAALDWGTAAGEVPVLLPGGLLDRARLPAAGSVGQGAVVLALPEEVVAAGTGNDVLTAGHIPALLALSDLTLTDEEIEVGTGVRSLDCSGEGIDCTFAGTTGTLVVHGERQIDLTYSLAHTATDPESQVAAAIGPAFLAATDMTLHRFRFTVTVPAGAVNIRSFSGLFGKLTRVSATSYTADGDMQTAQMRNITDGDADYVSSLTVRQCNACVIEALIPGDGFSVAKGEYFALGVSNFTAGGNPRPPFIHVFDGAAAPEDSHIGDDAYPFAPFAWAFKWSRATDEQVDDGDQVYHNARYRDRIEVDYEAGAPGLLRVDKDGTQQYLGPPHLNFAGAGCTVAENATTGAADVTCTGGSTTGITQAQGDARYLQLTGGDITGATSVGATSGTPFEVNGENAGNSTIMKIVTPASGTQKAFGAGRDGEFDWVQFAGEVVTGKPGLALGPGTARDTNLYRDAANVLRTDDAFRADTLAVTGTLATTQTNLGLNNACVDIGYAGTTLTCTQADGGTDTVTIAGGTGTDLENVATSILPDSDGSHGVGSAARTFAFGHFGELSVDTTLNIPDSSVAVGKLSATGTPSATTFLRGDGAWQTPAGGSATDLTNVTTDILPSADTTRNVGTTARTFASGHFQAMTVDNILTLGTQSLGDAYVNHSIVGQVVTFTQADGTTRTLTVPGGGGTADGVIDGATLIWNASTSTMGLDISRSVGANIQTGAAISIATTTTSGLTEYATDAETTAGTSSIRSLTPANVDAIRLNASQVNAGIMATARLANGTATGATFLRGDQQWAVPPTAAAADFTNIATDVLPASDNSGAVGTIARTWANGRFDALTVDGRFTATGGNVTVGGITVTGDLDAQNDIHLGDRDQLILGTDSDATFDFDDRTSHVEIRLNQGANGFVIYDGIGNDIVHEFDKDGSTSLIQCHTQAEFDALTPGDHVLYVISDNCPT